MKNKYWVLRVKANEKAQKHLVLESAIPTNIRLHATGGTNVIIIEF